jgi:c-di-GMP-binding flagellar brake protein YcgR
MSERRQVPRYIAEFGGQVSQPPGAPPLSVALVNISISGCSLEGAGSLKARQECEITFEWEGQQFRAEATVTWKSSKGEAGLKFLYVDPAHQELLKKVCATLRLQPLIQRDQG